MSIVEKFTACFAGENEEFPKLDLVEFGVGESQEDVGSLDDVKSRLADCTGEGWVECVDAVRYRQHGETDWTDPLKPLDPPINTKNLPPILNGEIVRDQTSSLTVRHLHEQIWRITMVSDEGNPCLAFETTTLGILQTGASGADCLGLTHRTYWDEERGAAITARFLGFYNSSTKPQEM